MCEVKVVLLFGVLFGCCCDDTVVSSFECVLISKYAAEVSAKMSISNALFVNV